MSTASTVRSGGWRLDSHERAALFDPLLVNNPIGVQVLGICSALAVTSSLKTALVMSIALTLVTAFSNLVISLLRNHTPSSIRMIVQMIVISSLVIVVDQTPVDFIDLESLKRLTAVHGRADCVALLFEYKAEQLSVALLVVNDQYICHLVVRPVKKCRGKRELPLTYIFTELRPSIQAEFIFRLRVLSKISLILSDLRHQDLGPVPRDGCLLVTQR